MLTAEYIPAPDSGMFGAFPCRALSAPGTAHETQVRPSLARSLPTCRWPVAPPHVAHEAPLCLPLLPLLPTPDFEEEGTTARVPPHRRPLPAHLPAGRLLLRRFEAYLPVPHLLRACGHAQKDGPGNTGHHLPPRLLQGVHHLLHREVGEGEGKEVCHGRGGREGALQGSAVADGP